MDFSGQILFSGFDFAEPGNPLFDFGALSAADVRLRSDPEQPYRIRFDGPGGFLNIDNDGYFINAARVPSCYGAVSGNFAFAGGSQLVFANWSNGYSSILAGGAGDDLLKGSPAWAATPLERAATRGDGSSTGGTLAVDGHFLVYAAQAGGVSQIRVHDSDADATRQAQTGGDPVAGWAPSASANASRVALLAREAGIVQVVLYSASDLDRASYFANARVSSGLNGTVANGDSATPRVSADASTIAYASAASNLVAGDTNGAVDVFAYRSTNQRVSVAADGGSANGRSENPSISGNGRYVAFDSKASNLVAGDANGHDDVFVRDLQNGSTVLVSQGGAHDSRGPAISDGGRYVAFYSYDGLGPAPDSGGKTVNVFVADLEQPGRYELVSADSGGTARGVVYTESASGELDLGISGDGRYVVFASATPRLVAGDRDTVQDVFVKDLHTGAIARLDAPGSGIQSDPAISADGTRISFAQKSGDAWKTYVTGNPLYHAVLRGGAGDDTYQIDRAGDVVSEARGGGIDLVSAGVSYRLGANLENLELVGAARNGSGNSLDNVLTGNRLANRLDGLAGSDTLTGRGGADTFAITRAGGVDTITDFATRKDHLLLDAGRLDLGDGDARIEGAVTRSAPGKFAAGAELVLFDSNVAGAFSAAKAAQKIGSARSDYADGDRRVFVVDNGHDSAVYLFEADGADARVSARELQLLAVLEDTTTVLADYLFA